MSKHRSYVFTINNYSHEDVDHILDMEAKYFCFGYEEGQQGTPHIQGYVQFENPIAFKGAKRRIGHRAHVEIAKGNFEQNIEYCSKEGEFYEFGERPSQTATYDQIKEVMRDPTKNPHMYRMYSKVYQDIRQDEIKKMAIQTEFYCIDPVHDLMTEVIEYFNLEEPEIAYITHMEELAAYDNPSIVILDPESDWQLNKKLINMYPRGVPINVKYGYQFKTYKPEKFIIRTADRQYYPLYKNIT